MVELTPGQTRWLEEAYRDHSERIFRTCLKFGLGDRDWAKDRTHEVFLKLAERVGEVQSQDDPGGWLYRVAVNECFMTLRRAKTSNRLLSMLGIEERMAPSVDRAVQAKRDLSSLGAALSKLPAKQRAVMVMVHLEGRTQAEAATLLSLSKGQISKLHKKAMTALAARDWEVPHD